MQFPKFSTKQWIRLSIVCFTLTLLIYGLGPTIVFFSCLPWLMATAISQYFIKRISLSQRLPPVAVVEASTIPLIAINATVIDILDWLVPQCFQVVPGSSLAQRKQCQAYQKQLLQSSQTLFILFLALFLVSIICIQSRTTFSWGVSLFIGGGLILWSWLGYEIWHGNDRSVSITARKFLISAGALVAFVLCSIILIIPTFGFSLILSFCFAFAGLGTVAGMLNLMRQTLPAGSMICVICDHTLEKLSPEQLTPFLSETEQVDQVAKSKTYEGWRCPNCKPSANDTSDSHRLLRYLDEPSVIRCKHCEGLTVIVETKIMRKPTKQSTGMYLTTQRCYRCKERKQTATVIPSQQGKRQ